MRGSFNVCFGSGADIKGREFLAANLEHCTGNLQMHRDGFLIGLAERLGFFSCII
mgnify:CR=1 FL=1